jgi:hypothetical protein
MPTIFKQQKIMKKSLMSPKFIFLLLIVIIAAIVLQIVIKNDDTQEQDKDEENLEEEAFNESGRAKAIIDETDLWKYYEDTEARFAIKYPHDVIFGGEEEGEYKLFIKKGKISELNDTMGYDRETALKNIESLKNNEYGQSVDFALEESQNVRNLGSVNAQEFMVLSRFEICNVIFERKLYFFNNEHQIVITLTGPKNEIVESMPEYFEINKENCGDEKIWDFEKQGQFFDDLENNNGSTVAQNWFNTFNQIVGTIEIFGESEGENNDESLTSYDLIQGIWTSVDDEKSAVEFIGDKKIDFYEDEKLSEATFKIYDHLSITEDSQEDKNGKYLIVGVDDEVFKYEIIDLSDKTLTLIYLPRGNILKYEK